MSKVQRTIIATIDQALKAKQLSARAASLKASGTGSVIANLRRGSSPGAETLQMLAEVLDLEFYFGQPRSEDQKNQFSITEQTVGLPEEKINQPPQPIPVIGRCAAGEAIIFDQPQLINASLNGHWAALQVRGDSMAPAFQDRDYVLIDVRDITEVSRLLGKRCLVELAAEDGGGGFLKQVMAGSRPGVYTLVSLNSAYQPIRDVRIRRARPVIGMLCRPS